MTTTLNSIAFKAYTHPQHRFQNLYGLLNSDSLYQSWGQLNKKAKPGIDGITMPEYQESLANNIESLSQELKQKCYSRHSAALLGINFLIDAAHTINNSTVSLFYIED